MAKSKAKQLYMAYGSNLNVEQMVRRCPGAEPVCAYYMPNSILRFRGVADMEYQHKSNCPVGLWWITRANEVALDRYEGVAGGMYAKRYLLLSIDGAEHRCLYYKMNSKGIHPPYSHYYDTIEQGYKDFDLDISYLERAVRHSIDRRYDTRMIRRRFGKDKLLPSSVRSAYAGALAADNDDDNADAAPISRRRIFGWDEEGEVL